MNKTGAVIEIVDYKAFSNQLSGIGQKKRLDYRLYEIDRIRSIKIQGVASTL